MTCVEPCATFGLKVGVVGAAKFEARIRELVEKLPDLAVLVEPLLIVRRTLREQLGILHRHLLDLARDDEVCRRLMTVPGIGPVVALTFRASIDVPARFRNSKAVGAVLGLTPCKYQSGESDHTGAISKCGDEMMRVMLYEAAQILLMRSTKWSWLKAWAMQIARRRGVKKAIVALARRLAVVMHRIWVDATEFRGAGKRLQQHDNARSRSIGDYWSSTAWWNDVPRGTMDEVRSHVCLDLLSRDGKAARKIVPPRSRIPYWKGLCAKSEEKHEQRATSNTCQVDGLKALDPNRPIREA